MAFDFASATPVANTIKTSSSPFDFSSAKPVQDIPDAPIDTSIGSQVKAGAKSAVESTLPAMGALGGATVGAETGAALGSLGGPVGTVIGGIGGGIVGGFAGEAGVRNLQENVMSLVPDSWKQKLGFGKEQRASEQKAMPEASLTGELLPAIASLKIPTKALAEGTNKFVANRLWDKASPAQKIALTRAEEKGLTIKPGQLQEGEQQVIQGTAKNQTIVNKEAAKATGAGEVSHVDDKFLYGSGGKGGRFNALSGEYDAIYQDPFLGGNIKLDSDTVNALHTAIDDKLITIPSRLKDKIKAYMPVNTSRLGSMMESQAKNVVNVVGDEFQSIMSGLKKAAREAEGEKAIPFHDTIHSINESMGNLNESVSKKLAELNPKYRATLTLAKARQTGAIDAQGNLDAHALGTMLKKEGSKEHSNPLSELGQLGEVLGISRKGSSKTVGSMKTKEMEIAGVSPFLRKVGKAFQALPESSAGSMIKRKAEGLAPEPAKYDALSKYPGKAQAGLVDLYNSFNK